MLQAQTHLAMPCLSFPLKALVTADSILNYPWAFLVFRVDYCQSCKARLGHTK